MHACVLRRRRLHAQVIKVGTSSLVRQEQNTLNLSNLARLCEVRHPAACLPACIWRCLQQLAGRPSQR